MGYEKYQSSLGSVLLITSAIFVISGYAIKLGDLYSGKPALNVTGLDAFVVELISFVLVGLMYGVFLIFKIKEPMQIIIRSLLLFVVGFLLAGLIYYASHGQILDHFLLGILLFATVLKLQTLYRYRFSPESIVMYPLVAIICLHLAVLFSVGNESVFNHLSDIEWDNNSFGSSSAFTDTLWALLYYVSIGLLLPVFLQIRKMKEHNF